ncbi:MAG: hypothetical protein AYK18_14600 [Theionarchaea archaeon DG-70]|nr:MAG: hypothetical protein AYK18_14600 [Theionarchaea archaeon DG-70]
MNNGNDGGNFCFSKNLVLPASLLWWDKKYSAIREELIERFCKIIDKTIKRIFGMKDLHVYKKGVVFWKAYIYLYLSSLLLQYLEVNGINEHRAIELLRQNHGLT